ncbi:BMP and activin membrane-bound inhibitor homolog [Lingula anatina]|uniref:BMP and activin membrane-bound inhibitor homolog n=1 Tax=Lingula anatina TaxID=7574 RepID=A0A1S3JFH6_LINAN|nr:BMP and activin membrane-bound inhibitor homolog [Lingula anatina]|eukprot:XP_013409167.1 BMP and activin membrane-bound inhibitor homolog [Lingula anatina]
MEVHILLILLTIWVTKTQGEVRCYCNEPHCIATGYMCKSRGQCFTQLMFDTTLSRSVHGCMESLSQSASAVCDRPRDVARAQNPATQNPDMPIIMCCKEDMCNYMDSLDISILVSTRTNETTYKQEAKQDQRDGSSLLFPSEEKAHEKSNHPSIERELWFKAAVIAVPIAGGFILIMLVLLAVRMLKHDASRLRHRKLRHHHKTLTKAQLYVADHFYDHGNKNAHFNNAMLGKQNKIYKDVHIKIDPEKTDYEKLKGSGSGSDSDARSSIVIWGAQPQSTENLTVV